MTTPSTAPTGLRLAPGLRVVRRGRDRLQVGVHPERRVVLPRRPGTEQLLTALGAELPDRLAGPAPLVDPSTSTVLAALADRDMLEPQEPAPPARVDVIRSPDGTPWPVDLEPMLDDPGSPLCLASGRPDAVLVLARGEPDRALLDPMVRDGVPHLVLTLVDRGARLGPLVVPGRTACVRCLDAHLGEADPDHLAVSARYAVAARAPRSGDSDPLLTTLVTAWALRDLALLLRPVTVAGGSSPAPTTWSTTLTWHPRSAAPTTRSWLRHPGCGCGWSPQDDPEEWPEEGPAHETGWSGTASGARPSGTMEA